MVRPKLQSPLTLQRKRLIELCQSLNFGKIEDLPVREGQPHFDSQTRVIKEVKFCAENGPRGDFANPRFLHKPQIEDLLRQLDELQDAHIDILEIKHGLPFKMEIQASLLS
jgi:hypothetical protein